MPALPALDKCQRYRHWTSASVTGIEQVTALPALSKCQRYRHWTSASVTGIEQVPALPALTSASVTGIGQVPELPALNKCQRYRQCISNTLQCIIMWTIMHGMIIAVQILCLEKPFECPCHLAVIRYLLSTVTMRTF